MTINIEWCQVRKRERETAKKRFERRCATIRMEIVVHDYRVSISTVNQLCGWINSDERERVSHANDQNENFKRTGQHSTVRRMQRNVIHCRFSSSFTFVWHSHTELRVLQTFDNVSASDSIRYWRNVTLSFWWLIKAPRSYHLFFVAVAEREFVCWFKLNLTDERDSSVHDKYRSSWV